MTTEEQRDMKLGLESEPREKDFSQEQEKTPEAPAEQTPNTAANRPAETEQPGIHTSSKQPKNDTQLTEGSAEEVKEVETILEEDLEEVYVQMDPQTQQKFKTEGEVTAKEIVGLLHHVKIKSRKIIKLISKWLSVIPGISKFFIEQEAKIKTDKILDSHDHEK